MTEPLDQWRGGFGDAYTARNQPTAASDSALGEAFRSILAGIAPRSILEVGCNAGRNLRALAAMGVLLHAVEPNQTARVEAQALKVADVVDGHAGDLPYRDGSIDLVFTSGVLIHIPDIELDRAYDEQHRVSARWLLTMEYFAPLTEEVRYRGQDGLLWKRDYGALWLDRFDVRLLDYGFLWKRATGLDDVTWWLFEKAAS